MIEVNPRVKDALRSGAYRKNYRINVLNDDGTTDFTLNNTELVSESVKIDERMCSGDTLKFGLCEGSSIEFQYFNHDNINHPNIRGRRIQVFVDVQYKDADGDLDWCAIPLGFFDIQECSTQFSTGIMKVVGYNKLRSDYLDQKANDEISAIISGGEWGHSDSASLYIILSDLLKDYSINAYEDIAYTTYENEITAQDIGNGVVSIQRCDVNGNIPANSPYWRFVYASIDLLIFPNDTTVFSVGDYINVVLHLQKIADYISNELYNKIFSDTFRYMKSGDNVIEIKDYILRNNQYGGNVYQYTGAAISTVNIVENIYRLYEHGLPLDVETDYRTFDPLPGHVEFGKCYISIPIYITYGSSSSYTPSTAEKEMAASNWNTLLTTIERGELGTYLKKDLPPMMQLRFTDGETMPDVTLRELQSAVYETVAEFGQLDRVTDLFSGVQLSRERLFPADDLYPSDALYPQSVSESTFKSMYEKLWTDSVGEQTFRKLYITYKGLDEEQKEKEFVLERTVNADGTTDYYCDDNWLFKNLVWTEQQVGDYADAMVLKMRGIKWFPFEMWSAGLPYIEVGDELEINTKDGTYTSYVLQRSLNGIQNLKDTYINGSLDIF